MPIMNEVMGAVGQGVQPKDNPDPSLAPTPTGGTAVDMNSLPAAPPPGANPPAPPAQPPAAQPDQQPQGDRAPASQPGDDDAAKQMDALLSQHQASQQPDDSALGKIKDWLSGEVQTFKANFRAGIARNSTEETTGLQQVYGADNVKVADGNIMVKKPGQKAFSKFNEDEAARWMHAALLGPALSHPVQSAGWLASQIPGMATQGAMTAGGVAAGAAAGGVPGAIAGGAAGGGLGSAAAKTVNQWINENLGQADPNFKYENKMSSLGDILNNDYVQAGLGAIGGSFTANAAVKAAQKASLVAKGLTSEEIAAVGAAKGSSDEALAKFTSALDQFHQTITPSIQTSGTESGVSMGREAMGAKNSIMNYWGKKIGAIEDDAAAEGLTKDKYLRPDNFFEYLKDKLPDYGVAFDEQGNIDASKSSLQETAPDGVKKLMGLYQQAKNVSSADVLKDGGMNIREVRPYLDALQTGANNSIGDAAGRRLFNESRVALNADRANHMAEVFAGDNSTAADTYKQAMGEYSVNSKAADVIGNQFNTPGKQDLMAKKISAADTGQALDTTRAIRAILGDDSPYWQNIKSGVIGRLMDKGGGDNFKALSGFIKNPDNKPFLQEILGDDKNINGLKMVLSQGEDLQNATKITEKNGSGLRGMINFGIDHMPGPPAVKSLVKLTGGNKAAIDYSYDTLLSGVKKAIGQEQKEALLKTINALDDYKSQATLVNAPIGKSGNKIMRYAAPAKPASILSATKAVQPDKDVPADTAPQPTASPTPQ
jgi:hypothetical protein